MSITKVKTRTLLLLLSLVLIVAGFVLRPEKAMAAALYTETINGVTWTYEALPDGNAAVGGGTSATLAVPKTTSGAIGIPRTIDGRTVTTINDHAFHACTNLTSIYIPNSVTSIGNYAFSDCIALANIAIPSSVTSIGNYAFNDCIALAGIAIPDGVTEIGRDAFNTCSSFTRIKIPNSVTSIDTAVFYNCTNLTSVTIPDSVIDIGEDAFGLCTSLTSIDIPNSVTSLGKQAFADCTNLANVTATSVSAVDTDAFKNTPTTKTLHTYEDSPAELSMGQYFSNIVYDKTNPNPKPTISTNPTSEQHLTRGDSTTLSVSATGGQGALSYQWYQNNTPVSSTPAPEVQQMSFSMMKVPVIRFLDDTPSTIIEGANNSTLTINGVDTPNAGTYYCVVTDEAGNSISSTNALITVSTGETLTAENPVGAVASLLGSSVTLTADTDGGTAPYNYQWSKNNVPIPNATSKNYTISSVTSADSGNYACEITDYTGTTTITNAASLSVSAQIDPTNNDGNSDGTMIIGVIQPLQIKAVVPTVITFHVDPNEPANYTSTPGGALTAPSFSFQNACNAPLSFAVNEITAQAGNPAVVLDNTFSDAEWAALTKAQTLANIAFGFVADTPEQWAVQSGMDNWYELTKLTIGTLNGKSSADLHLKSKYGLAWGNTTEQTITYDVVYLVEVA